MIKKNSASSILKQLGENAVKAAKKALVAAGEEVAEEARRRVPVKTGKLRDSIYVGSQKPNEVRIIADAQAEDGTQYGRIVEYGHGGKNAFLSPALEAKREAVRERIVDAVREAIRKR